MKVHQIITILLLLAISAYAQKSTQKTTDIIADKFTNAAWEGDLIQVKAMLLDGVDVNITRKKGKGWTALMAAVTKGKTDVVRYLIAHGADVTVKFSDDGITTLYQAGIRENNEEVVKALLEAGVNVNERTTFGQTALIRFVGLGRVESVRLLLKAGADVNIVDHYGYTAFKMAVNSGEAEIVRMLLPFKPDLNKEDENGEFPLMWAGANNRSKCLGVLIEAGANVNARSRLGTTSLIVASMRFFVDEVSVLLEHKADVQAVDNSGWNALMHTANSTYGKGVVGGHGSGDIRWSSATQIIRELIKAGTNVNAQNGNGETALTLAVKAGNEHFVEELLANGADASIKDKRGRIAVRYASSLPKYQRERIKNLLTTAN